MVLEADCPWLEFASNDAELRRMIDAWSRLRKAIRCTVMALIDFRKSAANDVAPS
jgi:hypothetical protein